VKNQEYSKQIIDTMISNNALDIENDEDYLATLGGIVALSAYLRSVARAMIDARYPEVSDTNEDSDDKSEKKKEKKEKKKEEKKEKKENKKKVKEEKKSDEE
jgi:hypothetical protein